MAKESLSEKRGDDILRYTWYISRGITVVFYTFSACYFFLSFVFLEKVYCQNSILA